MKLVFDGCCFSREIMIWIDVSALALASAKGHVGVALASTKYCVGVRC